MPERRWPSDTPNEVIVWTVVHATRVRRTAGKEDSMNTEVVVSVVSVLVGLVGLLFGIYKHRSTRKVAQLVYETCELFDFGVPPEFLEDIKRAPLILSVENTGNKKAEDIVITLRTMSRIVSHAVVSGEKYEADIRGREASIEVPKMNPYETLGLVLRCQKSAKEKQISEVKITHSEGTGVDKRSKAFRRATINLLFFGLEYDLSARRVCLVRIGPWMLRKEELFA